MTMDLSFKKFTQMITRKELISSKEYWLTKFQNSGVPA